jgi:putative CocE/NonD family hydrolase
VPEDDLDAPLPSRTTRAARPPIARASATGAALLAARGLLAGLVLATGCADFRSPPTHDAGDQPSPRRALYEGTRRTSHYVTMPDGVRLALDVILPGNLRPGERVPALLHQGRYWRSVSLRFPANVFFEGVRHQGRIGPLKEFFAERGYAWIDVDTRGSGASFGVRPWDYSPLEIQDGARIADWLLEQPWSDGRIAPVGISYSGGAAELSLLNDHAAFRAFVPVFCEFDQYAHILAPGGVPLSAWLERWGAFTRALDAGKLPVSDWRARLFVRGVRPAHPGGRRALREAQAEHALNWDFDAMQSVVYRDDTPFASEAGVGPAQREARERSFAWLRGRLGPDFLARGTDLTSAHAWTPALRAAELPVYAASGWFDGAYAAAAIQRFHALGSVPGSRLLLGPWDHALWYVSPHGEPGPSRFDLGAELLRFVDHHVRGLPTGLEEEAAVRYFTMGAEQWRTADRWPPPDRPTRWYLAEAGTLTEAAPSRSGEDAYTVDFEAGSGPGSRWAALDGRPLREPYPDRAKRDARLRVYDSPPLTAATEVTGHPQVTVWLRSTARDGALFAYLEDVAPDGSVRYVTEGMLRALHRRYSPPDPRDPVALPQRTFLRRDAEPLVPGEVAELRFELLPTSYVFAAGHRVRLALAGADRDHFALVPADGPPTLHFQRGPVHASHLVLPVVE